MFLKENQRCYYLFQFLPLQINSFCFWGREYLHLNYFWAIKKPKLLFNHCSILNHLHEVDHNCNRNIHRYTPCCNEGQSNENDNHRPFRTWYMHLQHLPIFFTQSSIYQNLNQKKKKIHEKKILDPSTKFSLHAT